MSIREELLSMGYTDDYVDEVATIAYSNKGGSLPKIKTFFDSKIGKLLSTDWIADWTETLINRLALYYYEKKQQNERKETEFTGDKTNPIDVYEYNAMNGIMPEETIKNEDGSYTHKYEDGTTVTVKVNLTSIVPESFEEYYVNRQKRLLADYLNIDEEIVLAMSDGEIVDLVNKYKSTNKEIKLTNK